MPGPGELRIRAEACGVNFADVLIRWGVYPEQPPLPLVPGFEVAGRVDAVGEGVDSALVGRDVLALTPYGGYAEVVCVAQHLALPRPAGMNAAEGAAFPVNYLTAHVLVERMGGLRADETVLVHSAGGGVGVAAVQLARRTGARILATASAHKHDFLKSLGVDACVDYHREDFEKRVRELTGGHGVELVLDSQGGRSFAKSCRVLAPTGRLGMFGMTASAAKKSRSWVSSLRAAWTTPWLRFTPPGLMRETKGVFGMDLSSLWRETERVRAWLAELLRAYEDGSVAPVIAAEVPFERASEAHHIIEDRRNLGKVILRPESG